MVPPHHVSNVVKRNHLSTELPKELVVWLMEGTGSQIIIVLVYSHTTKTVKHSK